MHVLLTCTVLHVEMPFASYYRVSIVFYAPQETVYLHDRLTRYNMRHRSAN
jgi:hypothetical protein